MTAKEKEQKNTKKNILGWWEWVNLRKLKMPKIKAKVDSGARTSALHAENIVYFKRRGRKMVRFRIYPHQNDRNGAITREAFVVDHRPIRSSGGHVTNRPVISSQIELDNELWNIEITLVDREIMGFRMLLGRSAIRKRFLIDPSKSNISGKYYTRLKLK